jgi:hypothetical protein
MIARQSIAMIATNVTSSVSAGLAGLVTFARLTRNARPCSAHRLRSRRLIVGTGHAPNIWVWARDVGCLRYSWDSHARYW